MESSRLSARLSAYLNAIDLARQAGVTWAQIGALFGTSGKYMAEAAKTAKIRYRAEEQLPLPLPLPSIPNIPKPQPPSQVTTPEAQSRTSSVVQSGGVDSSSGGDNAEPKASRIKYIGPQS
ncbi:MAG: hypothetical protein M0003_07250 [Acidithiobacillus sp.]|nr:hypothetical protein [Acidithiobacillus sp.]